MRIFCLTILSVLLVLLSCSALFGQEVTLEAAADTYTRVGVGAGSADVLDVRQGGNDVFDAYLRFDLSTLDARSIADATLTLHKVAGSRNDTIIVERHEVFGLPATPGNTPQDWDEARVADTGFGAERRANGVDPAKLTNLDADQGAPTQERIDGDTVSLTGTGLVEFLNQRLADNGPATFVVRIRAADRGYGFASREHSQVTLRPTLSVTPGKPADAKPTLWIIGDSTVRVGTRGQRGWGEELDPFFDSDRVRIENRAIGGRSSRTFRTENRWAQVLFKSRPGDYVLMQFGHNDPAPLDDEKRARGTIRGVGDEAKAIFNPITEQHEVVRSFGWYMRQYVQEARAHGVTPIVLSYIPRCPRPGSTVEPAGELESYALDARRVAEQEAAAFIDLNSRIKNAYVGMTPEQIKQRYFTEGGDYTHTSRSGAAFNAQRVVEGIRDLADVDLKQYLLPVDEEAGDSN